MASDRAVGRPEQPLDPSDGPVAAFAFDLRTLRQSVGNPSYRTMSKTCRYSYSGLSTAASGKKLPPWTCVEAYLTACKVTDPVVVQDWKRRWEAVRESSRDLKKRATRLAQESTGHIPVGSPPTLVVTYRTADLDKLETAEEFLTALDQIRGGISLRILADKIRQQTMLSNDDATQTLSRSRMHEVLRGHRLPNHRFVELFLRGCGMAPDEIRLWLNARRRIQRAQAALHILKSGAAAVARPQAQLNSMDVNSADSQASDVELRGEPEAGDTDTRDHRVTADTDHIGKKSQGPADNGVTGSGTTDSGNTAKPSNRAFDGPPDSTDHDQSFENDQSKLSVEPIEPDRLPLQRRRRRRQRPEPAAAATIMSPQEDPSLFRLKMFGLVLQILASERLYQVRLYRKGGETQIYWRGQHRAPTTAAIRVFQMLTLVTICICIGIALAGLIYQ